MTVSRLSLRSVVVVVRHGSEPLPAVVEDLRSVYARVPTLDLTWSSWPLLDGVQVVVGSEQPVEQAAAVLHGAAFDETGEVTDEQVHAALLRPELARDWAGTWCLVGTAGDEVALLVSPDLCQVVKHSRGPRREAWSNRGLAASRAAGARQGVEPTAVSSAVSSDFVPGTSDLLRDVDVLPEATAVRITAHASSSSSYWSFAERMATPRDDHRTELLRLLRPMGGFEHVSFALSGGQDSRLLADCFDELGADPEPFTFGLPGMPDLETAKAVCEQMGWRHRVLPPAPDGWSPSREVGVARSLWTEGLLTARDVIGPDPGWWFAPGSWLIWGQAGEIGRGFFWALTSREGALPGFLSCPLEHAQPEARAAWSQRLQAAFEPSLELAGGDPLLGLDVYYCQHRMHKWLGRSLPPPGTNGVLLPYTVPGVVQSLLSIPEDERRTGDAFRNAITGRVRDVSVRLVGPPRLGPPPRRERWARLVRERLPGARSADDRLMRWLVSQVERRGEAVDVIGPDWWRWTKQRLDQHAMRRWAWNALAVDLLAEAVDSLPAPPA